MNALNCWVADPASSPSIAEVVEDLRALTSGTVPTFLYHPLGFVYARILARGTATIRLHIWSEQGRPQMPLWDIHDHTFSFQSLVLLGKIRNECFAFIPDENGPVGLFTARYASASSILSSLGRFGDLRLCDVTLASAGECYTMQAEVLHRSCPCSDFVATLLRTEQAPPASSITVVGSHDHPLTVAYKREVVEDAISEQLLGRVVEAMESRPAHASAS